jgi:hypothetical protein
MNHELASALERLCASGRKFDRVVRDLRLHKDEAVPILVKLLSDSDTGWSRNAAAALARLKATPARAVPALSRLLKADDASVKVIALSALDYAPPEARRGAIPAVVRLFRSRPSVQASFTRVRAHLPRAVAAHFLALYGGVRGQAVLRQAAKNHRDPILHHIKAALENLERVPLRAPRATRRRRS